MTIVYRYHVIGGAYIRQPFDLDADPPCAGLDWLRVEPWDEPPSRVVYEYKPRKLLDMQCCACGHREQRRGVCNCRKCGDGWMRRVR